MIIHTLTLFPNPQAVYNPTEMKHDDYIAIKKELRGMNIPAYKGYLHLCLFFLSGVIAVNLSLSSNLLLYIAGQALLILTLLNGQILLHELGHGTFLRHRRMNEIFGHIVALAPIIPYKPWELLHGQHHSWSGNKFKDPTMVNDDYSDLKESQIKVINFCWKYWIPIFGVSYSLRAFWNIKNLKQFLPEHRFGILLSMILPVVLYGSLLLLFPVTFLKVWLPAYYIFMAIGEPLLFGQHVHIDQGDKRFEDFTKSSRYHVRDQDIFSRSLVFPEWFSKWVLLGFNKHAIHHIFPNLPGYEYEKVKMTFPNTMDWKEWYLISKSTDAATLLFKTNKDTNLIKGQI